MDNLGISTVSIVVRMFGFNYYASNMYCILFYYYVDSDVLIQILKFDIFFKYILRKRKFRTLTPSYLGGVSFETVTVAVNSPQPTLLCVITSCVCLSRIYEQDVPFLNFVVLSFVVFVVPTRSFVGKEVGRIWRLATEPGRG